MNIAPPKPALRALPMAVLCLCSLAAITADSAQAAGPKLYGFVLALDEQGKLVGPVAGAKIELQQGGGTAASLTADGSGRYETEVPAAGQYNYKLTAPGYKQENHGRGFRVVGSAGMSRVDFWMSKGEDDPNQELPELTAEAVGLLAGHVYEVADDGARNPIAGATIKLRRAQDVELSEVATGGGEPGSPDVGAYGIALPVGDYQASVSAPGFEAYTDPQPIKIEGPGADGNPKDVERDFELSRPASEQPQEQGITGRISIANGSQNVPPIKAAVVALGPGRGHKKFPVDDNGRFRLPLPPGSYEIHAVAEGYAPASTGRRAVLTGEFTRVTLTLNRAESQPSDPGFVENPPPVNIDTDNAGPTIYGHVLALNEKGELVGPVPGAQIEILLGGGSVASLSADGSGGYQTDLPAAGQYNYKLTAEGYKQENHGRGFQVVASSGMSRVDFWMSKGDDEEQQLPELPQEQIGLLSGHVYEVTKDGQREPIVGAAIKLRRGQDPQLNEVTTGASNDPEGGPDDGAYGIALPVGTYQASVAAPGFELYNDRQPIEMPPRGPDGNFQEVERDFELTRIETEPPPDQGIAGRILLVDASQDRPQIEAAIVALGPGRGHKPIAVDVNGRFRLALPPGSYEIHAKAEGYEPASSGRRAVLRGEYTNVLLRLEHAASEEPMPPTRLLVTVLGGQRGRPIVGAEVEAGTPGDDDDITGEETDAQGTVGFEFAEAGGVWVGAMMEGYRPAERTLDLEPGEVNEVTLRLERMRLELAWTARVKERSKDGRLRDLPQATVRLVAPGGDLRNSQTKLSGNDGTASFALEAQDDRPVQYNAIVVKDGYDSQAKPITLYPGQPNESEFVLAARIEPTDPEPETEVFTLRGYIKHRSSSGQSQFVGVPDASIGLRSLGSQSPRAARPASEQTSRRGEYAIKVPAGRYACILNLPDGYTEKPGERQSKQLDALVIAGDMRLDIEVIKQETQPVQQDVLLRGYVLTDQSAPERDGFLPYGQTAGGKWGSVPGSRVTLRRGGQTYGPATVDARGRFSMTVPAGGGYSASVSPPSDRLRAFQHSGLSIDGEQTVAGRLELRQDNRPVFVLARRVESPPPAPRDVLLRGYVLTDRNAPDRNGLLSFGRTTGGNWSSLPGARVMLRGTGGVVGPATVDSKGRFSMRVPVGRYSAQISPPSDRYQALQTPATIAVQPEQTVGGQAELRQQNRPVFVLAQRGRPAPPVVESSHELHVRVHGRTQQRGAVPLNGASVEVLRGNQVLVSRRTSRGMASFELPPSNYYVRVRMQGYREFAAPVTVSGVTRREVYLDAAAPAQPEAVTLAVKVFERFFDEGRWQSEEYEDAIVQVRGHGIARQLKTDYYGVCRFELPPGAYNIVARCPETGEVATAQVRLQRDHQQAMYIVNREVEPSQPPANFRPSREFPPRGPTPPRRVPTSRPRRVPTELIPR